MLLVCVIDSLHLLQHLLEVLEPKSHTHSVEVLCSNHNVREYFV